MLFHYYTSKLSMNICCNKEQIKHMCIFSTITPLECHGTSKVPFVLCYMPEVCISFPFVTSCFQSPLSSLDFCTYLFHLMEWVIDSIQLLSLCQQHTVLGTMTPIVPRAFNKNPFCVHLQQNATF